MANPTRLRIIEVLKQGEASVGAVAMALGCTLSTASRHLAQMRDQNVLSARKEGQAVFYSVRQRKMIECCQLVREVLIADLEDRGRGARDLGGRGAWVAS